MSVSKKTSGMESRRTVKLGALQHFGFDVSDLLRGQSLVYFAPIRQSVNCAGSGRRLPLNIERHDLNDELLILAQRMPDEVLQGRALARRQIPDLANNRLHGNRQYTPRYKAPASSLDSVCMSSNSQACEIVSPVAANVSTLNSRVSPLRMSWGTLS
jgi:hypothetical protein